MAYKSKHRQGPSWTEVTIGAALSVVIGAALGAGLLILRPVVIAKQEPKERVKDTTYYIEGSRDLGRGRQAVAKRLAFLNGESISVTEDEINVLVAAAMKLTAPQPGKDGAPAASPEGEYVSAGTPTVRIRDGSLQVGFPVTTKLSTDKIIFQARGGFVREGDVFVYEPTEMYLGSCPLQRIPLLASYLRHKIMSEYPMPDDMRAAWAKLTAVTIEGNTLKLTMP
jgi:hypothetical protein